MDLTPCLLELAQFIGGKRTDHGIALQGHHCDEHPARQQLLQIVFIRRMIRVVLPFIEHIAEQGHHRIHE